MTRVGPPLPLRRLLRKLDGVEMWHVEHSRQDGQRIPTVRYVVKNSGDEAIFERPHLAWRHFQQLTNAPDREPRPEPPPLDAALLTPKSGKTKRRRRTAVLVERRRQVASGDSKKAPPERG
jgi:hypothetical protein